MMDEDRVTLAKLEATMEGVQAALKELREEVRSQRGDGVTRGEWLQRNAYVDSKLDTQGADISNLRSEIASRRAPWWSTAAVLVSIAALVWTVFGPA